MVVWHLDKWTHSANYVQTWANSVAREVVIGLGRRTLKLSVPALRKRR